MIEIFLLSQKPITILLNGVKIDISKTDKKVLKFDEAKNISFDYYFTNSASNIFHSKVEFVDDEYYSSDENLSLVKVKENKYILKFLLKNECFLPKKCKKMQKNGLIFNFFQNGMVEIENESSLLFSEQYDFEIIDADILELKNNYFALKLYGKNEHEKGIILNSSFAQIICFDSAIIESTETGFKVLTNLFDIAGHGLVEVFEINEDIKKVDEYSVYLNGAPKRSFNLKVLPIYFLQCIRARDFNEAKRCLSQGLNAKAKIEHLSQFFGDFIDIIPFNNQFLLEYVDDLNRHFTKSFQFDIQNNKIQNIN